MEPALLEAAQRGDETALESLYRQLAPAVLGYLRGQGVADAEDATSEVFVGMVRGLGRFRGDERDFRAWLFSIAHRKVIDERRRRARRPEALIDLTQLADAPTDLLVGDSEAEALASIGTGWALTALGKLSPDQRAVVLLRVLADLSVEQTAAVLGKSLGAIKSLQRRGLAALARNLQREGVS